MNLPSWLVQGIDTYGYWIVLLAVGIESMGIPFPGETTLVAAAVYASTNHSLNIVLVIVAGAAGAILGDNAGYSIGKYGGYPLLQRLLRVLHVGEDKLLYTQRFFAKHGDKTVFFGPVPGGFARVGGVSGGRESHAAPHLLHLECGGWHRLGDDLWPARVHPGQQSAAADEHP